MTNSINISDKKLLSFIRNAEVKQLIKDLKKADMKVRLTENTLSVLYNDLIKKLDLKSTKRLGAEINYKNTFLLSEADFQKYSIEKNIIDRELGYDVELHICPILIAKSEKNDIEQKLRNKFQKFTGVEIYLLDHIEKFINILLKL